MTISDKMSVIHRRGFKVFPVHNLSKKFAVSVTDDNRLLYNKGKATGEYKHTTKTINEALTNMIKHVYKNIATDYPEQKN